MPCPWPTTHSSIQSLWICHQVVPQYDLQIEQPTIPLLVDPALYTLAIRRAMDSGLYEALLRQSDPDLPLRIGTDIEAVHSFWWGPWSAFESERGEPQRFGVAASPLGVVFGIVLDGLMGMQQFCRCKIRALQQNRDSEMRALLLPEERQEGDAAQELGFDRGLLRRDTALALSMPWSEHVCSYSALLYLREEDCHDVTRK
jgi:hypothetical protein